MLDPIITVLDSLSVIWTSLNDFLLAILSNNKYADHKFLRNLEENFEEILNCLIKKNPKSICSTIITVSGHVLKDELVRLTEMDNGLHFSATNATFEQMEGFKIQLIGDKMRDICPELWTLVQRLLTSDSELQKRKTDRWRQKEMRRTSSKTSEQDSEDNPSAINNTDDFEACRARRRHNSLILIVSLS